MHLPFAHPDEVAAAAADIDSIAFATALAVAADPEATLPVPAKVPEFDELAIADSICFWN